MVEDPGPNLFFFAFKRGIGLGKRKQRAILSYVPKTREKERKKASRHDVHFPFVIKIPPGGWIPAALLFGIYLRGAFSLKFGGGFLPALSPG